MYEIKKGIKMPEKTMGLERRFPWAKMDVGDCFDIILNEDGSIPASPYQSAKVYRKNHNHNLRITIRRMPEIGVARVWRIE